MSREVKERKDAPAQVSYVLHTPKRHHPQRTVTSALLINLPDDLLPLDAVITHPFLNGRVDRLVAEEGYHPEERVYLQNMQPFAPVPVQQAIAELDELFYDFPFATTADRTNLFATVVTRICRRSYDIAPMFLFDKPQSGTGATLLANLVAVLTTGKKSERVTYCNGEMLEFEKRVAATCRAASGIVLLDNLSGVMASAMLAELLTADDSFTARDLGTSRNLTFNPRNFVIVGTADNVTMTAELGQPHPPRAPQRRRGTSRPAHGLPASRRQGLPAGQSAPAPQFRFVPGASLAGAGQTSRLGTSPRSQALPRLAAADCGDPRGSRPHRLRRQHRGVRGPGHHRRRGGAAVPSCSGGGYASVHPVMAKDLDLVALGDPNDDDSEGMLKVKGANDKQRGPI